MRRPIATPQCHVTQWDGFLARSDPLAREYHPDRAGLDCAERGFEPPLPFVRVWSLASLGKSGVFF
jgi:hypothetical protein